MLRSCRPVLLFVVVGLLALSGCRTYGGYDSEPKTYAAMQRTVQSFEDELDRAKADLRQLEEAAAEVDTLQSMVDQFRGLVTEHESLLDTQHRRVDRLSPEASYRNLHAAYGATLTEQRLMQQKYQQALRQVRTVVQNASPAHSPVQKVDRQYTVRPIGFPKLRAERELTMEQALRGL